MRSFITEVGRYNNCFSRVKSSGILYYNGTLDISDIYIEHWDIWEASNDEVQKYLTLKTLFEQHTDTPINLPAIWNVDLVSMTATFIDEGIASEEARLYTLLRQEQVDRNKQHNHLFANALKAHEESVRKELVELNPDKTEIINDAYKQLDHQIVGLYANQYNGDNTNILNEDILNLNYVHLSNEAFLSLNVLKILIEGSHNEEAHTINGILYDYNKIMDLLVVSGASTQTQLTPVLKALVDWHSGNQSIIVTLAHIEALKENNVL